jgi:hypothetical protein
VSCFFVGNGAVVGGGLLAREASAPILQDCIFARNFAEASGGAVMAMEDSPVALESCTIAGNGAGIGGGLHRTHGGALALSNCIVWGNRDATGASSITGLGPASAMYCDVESGWPGKGNIDADPLFRSLDALGVGSFDLRLRAGSPAIDAGHPALLPADLLDLDGDGDVLEPMPHDAIGGLRIFGAGLDMGALEHVPDPVIDRTPLP